ncbi:hypothetical protein KSP39_PZI014691 [Platanthera zijinensis]|uniref:Uncharacterized protein n=1 Tax=Platanthera zijinensis TaxID=2320716 RepID=A0AAP0B9U3_9ASPA
MRVAPECTRLKYPAHSTVQVPLARQSVAHQRSIQNDGELERDSSSGSDNREGDSGDDQNSEGERTQMKAPFGVWHGGDGHEHGVKLSFINAHLRLRLFPRLSRAFVANAAGRRVNKRDAGGVWSVCTRRKKKKPIKRRFSNPFSPLRFQLSISTRREQTSPSYQLKPKTPFGSAVASQSGGWERSVRTGGGSWLLQTELFGAFLKAGGWKRSKRRRRFICLPSF